MFVVFPAVIIVIASAFLGSILFFFAVGLVWTSGTLPKGQARQTRKRKTGSARGAGISLRDELPAHLNLRSA